MYLVVMSHKKWLSYFAHIPDAALQILNRVSLRYSLDIILDTASFKAGGSIIPNEVPVTAGLVERLSDAKPNPFTKFILTLCFRINPKRYLPLSRAAQASRPFFTSNSNVEVD